MRPLHATVIVLACYSVSATATTYPPVSFEELVTRADVIFVGEVVDVRALALQTRERQVIKTRVTFRVIDPILGTTGALEVFEFMGGELQGIVMTVAGMPQFTEGDRRFVFARRGRSINPIVGFTHGLLRIVRDQSGIDRIFTLSGTPVAQLPTIGSARTTGAPAVPPISLAAFREQVRSAVEARRP